MKTLSSKTPSSSNSDGSSHPEELERLRCVLLASIRRRCPAWLVDQSEDIVHEAMTRVLEHTAKAAPGEPVGAGYWMRAAHNEMVSEIRKRRSSLELSVVGEERDEAWHSSEPGPERLFLSRQKGWAVFHCLQGLAGPRKQAVTLYLRGYTAKDSGEILSWPVRRVQNLVFRGLRDLRSCLDRNEVER